MSPAKHSAICAQIQQLHQAKESKLLARIEKLEAQRKPLTDEQLIDLWPSLIMHQHTYAFARAIEAAHGIKE